MTALNPLSYDDVSSCKLCPNLSRYYVPSDGNPCADVMLIGQSPGKTEAYARRPFCGPSGDLVNYMLEEANLVRSEVYIANTLKCHPPGNRKALAGETNNCINTWLKSEIMAVKPKLIILLGADAHNAILPPRFHFEHLSTAKSKNFTYITSYHPAYFLRRNNVMDFVQGLGRKVKDMLEVL